MLVLRDESPITHDEYEEPYFIIVNKPTGPSSHEVTAWVKKLLGAKKTGHAGTLDPKVTGVLVIAVDKAVRFLKYFAESDKEYICVMQLGSEVAETDIRKLFKEFSAKLYQTPPLESAVKKVLRTRVISKISFLEMKGNLVLFKVKCQHGTYIRNLCKDIGEVLGVGAVMEELRRTRSGYITEEQAFTLHEIADNVHVTAFVKDILPLKKIVVVNNAVSALCHGADLARVGIASLDESIEKDDSVILMTASDEVIGTGIAAMSAVDMKEPKKGLAVITEVISMPANLYPRGWK